MKILIVALITSMSLTACSSDNDTAEAPINNVDSSNMKWDQDNWTSKNWE